MQSFLHALNIGTMATWLSVSGASTVACLVQVGNPPAAVQERDLEASFGDVVDLNEVSGHEAAGSAAPGEMAETTESIPQEAVEPVQEVAPLPELAEMAPLPDVPDLDLKADDLESSEPKPKAVPRKSSASVTTAKPQGAKKGTPGATGVGNGAGNGSVAGSGSGDSGAGVSRFSRGNFSKPKYPEECRRANQEGRVVVTFTVDEAGNVVSAKATGKSPYPALDQSAVDAMYRSKFAPGPRASASKSIVFNLK